MAVRRPAALAARVGQGGKEVRAPGSRDSVSDGYPPLLDGLQKVIERLLDSVGSAIALIPRTNQRLPDHLGMHARDDRFRLRGFAECAVWICPVARQDLIDVGEVTTHKLHVLLRHRPRSISLPGPGERPLPAEITG